MKFAGVIIDISIEQLDKKFQYIIPETMDTEIEVGSRVQIPFGSTVRKGYVVEITEEPEIEIQRMKEIMEVCKESVKVDSNLIKLAYWMKTNYGSTINQALKMLLPVKEKIKESEKKTIRLLISRDEAVNIAREAEAKHRNAQARLLYALAENPVTEYSLLNQKLNISMSTIKSLEEKGYIDIEAITVFRNAVSAKTTDTPRPELNEGQKAIVGDIIFDMDEGNNIPCLIKGVTGSGKTEIYMELIEHTISAGKEVICLIPEIALTYQTVMRFYNRFGDKVAVINSRLSKGEKYDTFVRAREGKIKIIIGPRSALFTPFGNLGLIIIDEEHEGAYKSEITPKYHARETAIEIARMNDAKVVMGSATPSLDSYYKAETGEYKLYCLEERAGKGKMPGVEIVDLREEMKRGNRSIFSYRLEELINEKLNAGEQVMLFLNRRGYQGFINCRDCGHIVECPHCAVSLTEHKGNKLICHYCGYETPQIKACPECGGKHIGRFKAGTEKVEEETKKFFPNARVLRMDLDTTKGKDGHARILEQFHAGEADILIGTQMIVKGHDFPNVTLVGILLADTTLHMSDYMASERTFELLTQAAGRAGRGEKPGKVIIQTYDPEHYSIRCSAEHDYDAFYEEEIAYRDLMNYPPVMHMLNIRVASEDENCGEKAAALIKQLTEKQAADGLYIIGPSKAAIYKISDVYYRTIYYKHKDYKILTDIKDLSEKYIKDNEDLFKKCQVQYDFR